MTQVVNSQQLIKENHLKLVFSLIHEVDGISRADIKKLTKLSATTISALVEELMAKGLVVESGIKSAERSGRKAISLSVNSSGGYFAVVSVSGYHFRLRLFDLFFEEIFSKKVRYDNSKLLSETLTEFLAENVSVKGYGELLGIAVGLPAIIDDDHNIVSSTVLSVYENDNVYETLCQSFKGSEVVISNSSAFVAYAEMEFGDTDSESLISVDISDGVGASAIVGGAPFLGNAGMACEFGHVSVDMNGKKCRCGSRGCLETIVSIPAIVEKASEICKTEIDIDSLAEAVAKNDELTKYIDYVCEVLAFGINNLINMFDPGAVIICGDILTLGERFISKLRTKLKNISLPGRYVSVMASTLGDNAEYKGGAKYIFDCLFR
ncbi:MAG: ROK family transcriptional regulator [Clostridia bacterium]|nr:ROK family transcriptional regulator [Clostridia bacterium]